MTNGHANRQFARGLIIGKSGKIFSARSASRILLQQQVDMAKLLKNWAQRPWHEWYKCGRWKERRAYQLRIEPLCAHCHQRGLVRPADTVDHIQHHGQNWNSFWLSPLQSLCRDCHEIKHGRKANPDQIGLDGYPVRGAEPVEP